MRSDASQILLFPEENGESISEGYESYLYWVSPVELVTHVDNNITIVICDSSWDKTEWDLDCCAGLDLDPPFHQKQTKNMILQILLLGLK